MYIYNQKNLLSTNQLKMISEDTTILPHQGEQIIPKLTVWVALFGTNYFRWAKY